MRYLPIALACLAIIGCRPTTRSATGGGDAAGDPRLSIVRVNSTQQEWNQWQPWDKEAPTSCSALAAIIGPQQVLTTAELAINATYIEFESADGTRFIPARVIARDDEANLALLGPADPAQGEEFFANTAPLEVAQPPFIGDPLDILQLEANGVALLTSGTLQSVDLVSSAAGQAFLTYQVKASMQSAASSYSLPVLFDGRLAGVLLSYDPKDQICDVASTDIVRRFLDAAKKEPYVGFPSLGVNIALTVDPSLRQWLKLSEDQGGLYLQDVRKGSAADLAGLKQGDVILAIDGNDIDRRGYYEHPRYGSLSWGHLVRGEKAVGDAVNIRIQRDGQPMDLTATVSRENPADRLVPLRQFDRQPAYLVKGGLLFQELTLDSLERYGDEWNTRAPLNLIDAYENPERYQDRMRRVVFLSATIPTPATIGYERLRNMIVSKVNGVAIRDMADLVKAFSAKKDGLHSVEFVDEHLVIHLDEAICSAVDGQLVQQGLTKLHHVEE